MKLLQHSVNSMKIKVRKKELLEEERSIISIHGQMHDSDAMNGVEVKSYLHLEMTE